MHRCGILGTVMSDNGPQFSSSSLQWSLRVGGKWCQIIKHLLKKIEESVSDLYSELFNNRMAPVRYGLSLVDILLTRNPKKKNACPVRSWWQSHWGACRCIRRQISQNKKLSIVWGPRSCCYHYFMKIMLWVSAMGNNGHKQQCCHKRLPCGHKSPMPSDGHTLWKNKRHHPQIPVS